MNFSKAEVKKKDQIPSGYRKYVDYTPLFRKVATLEDEEALQIPIDKTHETSNIQRALDKEFQHTKFKAFTRTINNQKYCFVTKK